MIVFAVVGISKSFLIKFSEIVFATVRYVVLEVLEVGILVFTDDAAGVVVVTVLFTLPFVVFDALMYY